jgi:Glycosyl transferase family 2
MTLVEHQGTSDQLPRAAELPKPSGNASDRSAPLVSIVVISYNYAPYVATAIRSALSQTYRRIEVIVVDDGSSDGSQEIIAEFGEQITARFKQHGGETSTNNVGFALSSGDIVMFLDSDDALHPRAAEEVVAHWRPRASKIQFCLSIVDELGRAARNVFPHYAEHMSPGVIREAVLRTGLYLWPPTTGNAFARSFLKQVMPLSTREFPAAPDGVLNAVAPLFGDVITINQILGYYRAHGANAFMTTTFSPEKMARAILWRRQEANFLQTCANALRVCLPANLLDQPYHLANRIAILKVAPDLYPLEGDTVVGLCTLAVGKLFHDRGSAMHRSLLLLWFIAVALAPRQLATRIAELRFVGVARPPLLGQLLKHLGVARKLTVADNDLNIPEFDSAAALGRSKEARAQ